MLYSCSEVMYKMTIFKDYSENFISLIRIDSNVQLENICYGFFICYNIFYLYIYIF